MQNRRCQALPISLTQAKSDSGQSRGEGITLGVSFSQTSFGGLAEAGDQFGAVLAVGDFNGDLLDDVVVGAPGDALGTEPSTSGVAFILNAGEIRFKTKPF